MLAIGHLESNQYQEFLGHEHYYPSPWPFKNKAITTIPKDKTVAIAGTRLTAIDAVFTLVDNGHTGPITLLSRSGLLPSVRGKLAPYTCKFLTLEKIQELTGNQTRLLALDELAELLWQELEFAEGKKLDRALILNPDTTPLAWLESEIQAAEDEKLRPWQLVLESLYPIIPTLWNALSLTAKKEFIRDYYSIWTVYVAAFPLENAKKALSLLQSGQVTVTSGVDTITFNQEKNGFEVYLNGSHTPTEVDYFIKATGMGHDITQADSPLLKNLLQQGLIRPHPIGGIDVDFKKLRVIDKENHSHDNLFVIGDQTWGVCLETADLGQTVSAITRVINALMATLIQQKELAEQHLEHEAPLQGDISGLVNTQQQIEQFITSRHNTLRDRHKSPTYQTKTQALTEAPPTEEDYQSKSTFVKNTL